MNVSTKLDGTEVIKVAVHERKLIAQFARLVKSLSRYDSGLGLLAKDAGDLADRIDSAGVFDAAPPKAKGATQ